MHDLREDILKLFAEAQLAGRRRRFVWAGYHLIRKRKKNRKWRILPHAAIEGRFVVPMASYHAHRPVTITRSPCYTKRWTCPSCGGVIEWREGLTRRQAVHIGRSGVSCLGR